MPGCAIHLLLATRVLARWGESRSGPPFPIADGECREAFRAGSMGPDLGYYPVGRRLLSDLAHYLKAVDLARSLIRLADDEVGRAFAWGWAGHVLADVDVHPLINRSVGRRRGRGGPEGLSYAEDPVGHVRVELGLDAYHVGGEEVPRRLGPSRVFDRRGMGFVASAYEETYGFRPDPTRLLGTFRGATLLISGMLAYERLIAPGMRAERRGRLLSGLAARAFRAASWPLPASSEARGLLRPVPPSPRLLAEVDAALDGFVDRFLGHYERGLADLPAYNLDTGREEGDRPEYPRAVDSLRRLDRLRAGEAGGRRDHRPRP